MTIKTRIDSAAGAVSTNNDVGVSIERSTSNYGFMPYKVDGTAVISASATITPGDAGVNTITGSAAVTVTMPSASLAPGAMFVFRHTGNAGVAHVLTGALEVAGTKVFTDGLTAGSKLTLSQSVGTSVALLCDGVNYLVMAHSSGSAGASFTISGV